MAEIFALLVVVVVALVAIRTGALALERTGLATDIARFQAQSAFMGVGFTTAEAENVVRHPVRRQVVRGLMWAGYGTSTAAIGTIAATLIKDDPSRSPAEKLGILILCVVSVLLLWRIHIIERLVDWSIKRALRTVTWLDHTQLVEMLELGDHVIAQVNVTAGSWLAGSFLRDLRLTDEGVLVLTITRANGTLLQSPGPETALAEGDVLVCYGPEATLEDLPERAAGPTGAERHRELEALQRAAVAHEAARDPARID